MRLRNVFIEFSFLVLLYLGILVWLLLEFGWIVMVIMILRMIVNMVVVLKYVIVWSFILLYVLVLSFVILLIKFVIINGMISILSMCINIFFGNCKYMIFFFVNCFVVWILNLIVYLNIIDSKSRIRIRFCFNFFRYRCNILVLCFCWYEFLFLYRIWVLYFVDVLLL